MSLPEALGLPSPYGSGGGEMQSFPYPPGPVSGDVEEGGLYAGAA